METNVNNTTEPQHDAKLPVSGSVFVLQHKETMRIHGCFATKEDAEKYANNSQNIAIMKLDIA